MLGRNILFLLPMFVTALAVPIIAEPRAGQLDAIFLLLVPGFD